VLLRPSRTIQIRRDTQKYGHLKNRRPQHHLFGYTTVVKEGVIQMR
jgi:hypothetical protein